MAASVTIYTTALSYRVRVDGNGQLVGTRLFVNRFVEPFTEMVWNPRLRQKMPNKHYRYYNQRTQFLHLPRYDLPRFEQFLLENETPYTIVDVPPPDGVPVTIPLRSGIKDRTDLQTRALAYLTDPTSGPLRGLALQTGCIAGDTSIDVHVGGVWRRVTMAEAYRLFVGLGGTSQLWHDAAIRSHFGDGVFVNRITDITHTGVMECVTLTLANGTQLTCTPDHRIWVTRYAGTQDADFDIVAHGWTAAESTLGCCVLIDSVIGSSESQVIAVEPAGLVDTYDIGCAEPANNYVANGVVVHNSGKTYTAIKALSLMGLRGIIFCKGLVDQWVRSIKQFTTLDDADIFVIKGGRSLRQLLDGIDRTLFPKIIVCSLGTIRPYCLDDPEYDDYPPFDRLMGALGIGVRITDEAHSEFHLNLMLDLRFNVQTTFVLTATFSNSRPEVKRIFDRQYPIGVRFGESEIKRYTNVYAYEYYSGWNDQPKSSYATPKGYSHTRWEAWILGRKEKFEHLCYSVYIPILAAHYVNVHLPGQRCLILSSSVEMCRNLARRVHHDFPEKTCVVYVSDMAEKGSDKDAVLGAYDFIFSTPGSAGTGRDIPNLLHVLCTISMRTDVVNIQILGRLRELPNSTPSLAYTWTRSIPPQAEHAAVRKVLFVPRARQFCEILL